MRKKINKEKKVAALRKARRLARTSSALRGTAAHPRLTVFRSGKHIHAQLIDDEAGCTLLAVSDAKVKKEKGSSKVMAAEKVGQRLAELALEKGIKNAIFDRRSYRYHGRVRALAEGARKGGLSF